ncbi:hypothetical protein GCWU000341_00806 [Oribacterium sp. oral taxon 078 str. F0262]|nr:hypothetical protein GCWU000341_00806 [Oribacterium sp. oral taxon 078 str. F0262]
MPCQAGKHGAHIPVFCLFRFSPSVPFVRDLSRSLREIYLLRGRKAFTIATVSVKEREAETGIKTGLKQKTPIPMDFRPEICPEKGRDFYKRRERNFYYD